MIQTNLSFRVMLPTDWEAVAEIYRQGIATGNAAFQQNVPTWEEWDEAHLPVGRIVALENEAVVGWAALTPVSGRCVYAGVAETSVYVLPAAHGKGIGRLLLEQVILESETEGLWTLQAGIFPENEASIRLHESCGFRKVGYREKIGKMNGIWRDTLLFERRSSKIGVTEN